MSAAHTCVRSALTQAFRPSNRGIATPCSVPAFLVPALARPPRCSFSSGKRRSKEQQPPPHPSIDPPEGLPILDAPSKITHKPLRSLIPFPNDRGDIEQWLAAIEPFLPAHLRRIPSNDPDVSSKVTAVDLSIVLVAIQDASLDILSHLGLVQGRWQTVVWMAKKLVEGGRRSIEPPVQLGASTNMIWPEVQPRSLQDLTNGPLRLERVRPSQKLNLTLDELTSAPDTINLQHTVVKRALGQLWRSLGNLILVAAERSNAEEDTVMPHVLEIIAYLHHVGFMPDSVYTYRPHANKHALQQPPTLHMLSSTILTALSDATWKAHEASVKVAKERMNAQYFLGHEIPGSRYKVQVTEIAPELWLELVLWSCLHGGWTLDGIAILKQLLAKRESNSWGLISWREIIQAEQATTPTPSRRWSLFPMRGDASASAEDRAKTRRTISSEIVTAFIDSLVNQMRLGVGARGTNPETLVDHIKSLKQFLDSSNLSLGSAAWDSIMVRLLESGGFIPEKRPELLLRIFDLATGFGAEVSTANVSAANDVEVPYFFEPTTIPLSLLHHTLRVYIGKGDIKSAMTTLMLLQQYTDSNKQKSVQQFFETLKSAPSRQAEPFTSRLPPVDFPAFDAKLPIPVLAKLLNLATESKLYDLGRWFLNSGDLDGPLIGRDLYGDRNIAASIIQFGSLAGENDLVLKVIKKSGVWDSRAKQQRMPAQILTALLRSQIQLRRWESVKGMQKYVEESFTFRPRPVILSTFAAELLRTSRGTSDEKMQAQQAFTGLLFGWESIILRNIRNELYCALAIMSTVDGGWKEYCSRFLALNARQGIKLSTDDFNQMLSGVLDGYGSSKGKEIVERWCYTLPKNFGSYRAPGGLLTMPRFRPGKGEEYEDRPEDIEVVQASGARLILQGRVHPNRQTVWAILRKIQEEIGEDSTAAARAKVRDTLKWAARLLYYLGLDYEDTIRDLGSLADLAELEAPAAPNELGYVQGAQHDFFPHLA
ncbi:hypothetical protein P153DRAFT_282120 [Dothidotthia symphoricarpi CBS 119687]|uniref:Uncharacterized protein n=1 Tax=Dothidotthia symphoricarpi CBS 119687 TaxID=1392245 RepID=A0A6A6AQD1_9PLEO|nr:uncharacterized protein P153DRAFT_282120 [Dothidotthia symphoricarpi CBS 119687]KAF2133403.1 hypothetical protein P153DRAFT_282120 [Dothidotthia symphoricarpi CBS 119687]